MTDDRADDLPALAIRRPWLVAVLNLLIVIAGLGAWLGVEVRELPNIDRPIVAVRADYPGAIEARKQDAGRLYNVAEFAAEVASAAIDPIPAEHTRYVGDTSGFVRQ